jgi:hypothetical protein
VPKRKPVQEASFTDKEFAAWLEGTVRPVIPIALSADAPRVAGEHCRFCAADGQCPAQYDFVQTMAAQEFKTNNPKSLPLAAIGRALDALGVVEQIGKSIKAHAITLVHAGKKVPGYEKSFSAASRMWLDAEEANERLTELGLEKRERYSVELVSPAQAEKALKAKGKWPKRKRGSAADDFDNPFDGVLGYTETSPTIRKTER